MTVFPRSFARWLVLNEFDRTRKTAEWYKFKNCLWTHLNNHLTYDQSERLRYQQESLFKDCSRDVLLLAGKPTGPRREEVSMDVPNSHLFNEPILLDLKKATEVEVTTGEAVAPMYEEGGRGGGGHGGGGHGGGEGDTSGGAHLEGNARLRRQ